MKKNLLLIIVMTVLGWSPGFAQERNPVSGSVKDTEGIPLPGVSIVEKGTKNGVQTNLNGSFTIKLAAGSVLKFTYMGYSPKEVAYTGQSTINVTLEDDATALGEVVITAFGQKKETRKLAYSVQQVKGEDLARANSPNVVNALQGKVAGVMINQGTSGPTSSSRIRIRGNSSLNSNTQPLFVVDGVLMQPGTNGQDSWGGAQDFGNITKNLNPDDYESVSVLKGSAASALYGSLAQNGVILITTKKGRSQKGLGVTLTHTQSFDDAYRIYDLQNEFGGGLSSTFEKDAKGIDIISNGDAKFYSYGPKFDGRMVQDLDGRMRTWEANNPLDFYQTGRFINTNVAVEGGNETTTFRFSYNKQKNNGISPNNEFGKDNFSIRATQKLAKFLNIDAGVTYTSSKGLNPAFQGSTDNPLFRFTYYRARSLDINYWINNYKDEEVGGRKQGAAKDPYGITNFAWNIYERNNEQTERNLRGNLDITATITPWLNVLLRGNMNTLNTESELKALGSNAKFEGGSYGSSLSSNRESRFQGLVNLNRELTDDLELNLSAGGETYRILGGKYANSWTNGGLKIPGIFSIGNSIDAAGLDSRLNRQKRIDALYAYGDLSWKDMLTFSFSGRNDWSSTLTYADGHGKNTYFYPSAGLSWIFSEVLKPGKIFSFGKLRASYAYTGLDAEPYITNRIGYYESKGNYDSPGGLIPRYGFTGTELRNDNLKNELTKELEFGADLRFFENRIGLDISYYKKNSYNQILSLAIPVESGGGSRYVNAGNIQNQGIEVLLSTTPIKKRNLEWNSNFNFSRNNNKIIELVAGQDSKELDIAFGNDVVSLARVGSSYATINTGYGYAYYQKKDANGNSIASPANGQKVIGANNNAIGLTFLRSQDYDGSRRDLGTAMEKYLVSNLNTVRYKNLSFGVQVDAKVGGLMASGTHQYGSSNGALESSLFGRDKEHGGITFTDDDGVTRNDGIIPEGVLNDGVTANVNGQTIDLGGMQYAEAVQKGYLKPIPAVNYYENLTQWGSGIREYSIFENTWVALREVSIGYNLPTSLLKKVNVNSMRLSVTGRNLLYLYSTTKDGINPEGVFSNRAGSFQEYGGMPYVRSFGLTLNAGF